MLSAAQHNYREISMPQLMEKIRQGDKKVLVLDVRTKGENYDTSTSSRSLNIGHIKDRINIPIQDLQQKPEAISQLEQYKDLDIYVVCSHSYRSRTISNLLMSKGFDNITNVQGGMSEWYRNYDGLKQYASLMENEINYDNISPSEAYDLIEKKKVLLLGFSSKPRTWFDSSLAALYYHLPELKNSSYYTIADSSAILEKANAHKNGHIILYNTVGSAAADVANWLANKGIKNVHYLVGNLNNYYEYLVNFRTEKNVGDQMLSKSGVRFYTPLSFCRQGRSDFMFVDLRHDTLFAKKTNGTKLTYTKLKSAINFPFYKTADEFMKAFPDKSKEYILLGQQNHIGTELAGELAKKGYRIGWVIGGNERWEWYTNNIPEFKCGNWLE